MNWTAENLPDMSGRRIVVTGATSGIGEVTARELARVGATVILAVRDVAKGAAVASSMTGDVHVRELDVSSQRSVRAFADSWSGELDILINNAGIMQVPEAVTEDGFEMQIATNYLGPFALTNLLLPYITGRIVTVSSQLHRFGTVSLTDLNWRTRKYNDMKAYEDSKLADASFAIELDRRLQALGSPVRSLVAHPGIAATSLVSHVGGTSGFIFTKMRRFLNSPEGGALPTLYAATADVAGGSYVGPGGFLGIKGSPALGKASRRARDTQLATELWTLTEELTKTESRTFFERGAV